MSITLNTAQHLRDNLVNLNENLLGLDKKIKLIDTRLQNPILLVIGIIFTLGILQLVFVIQKAVIKAQMRKINAEIICINTKIERNSNGLKPKISKPDESPSSNSSPELPQTPRIITENESPKPEAPTELEIIAHPQVITEQEIIAQPEVIVEEEIIAQPELIVEEKAPAEQEALVEQEAPVEQEVFTETKEDEAIAAEKEYQPTSEELHEKFDPAIDAVLEKIAATVNRAENAEEAAIQANTEVVQAAARATLAKNIPSLVRGSKIRKAMKNAKAAISKLKEAEADVAQSFLDCNNIFKKWEEEKNTAQRELNIAKLYAPAEPRLQWAVPIEYAGELIAAESELTAAKREKSEAQGEDALVAKGRVQAAQKRLTDVHTRAYAPVTALREAERKLRSFEEESLKDSEAAGARLLMAKEKEEKLSKAADEALMKLGLIKPRNKKQ